MKAVMLSIRPKWCELIASGKKTSEVRKTRPNIPAPFKCYIYCTKPKMVTKYVFKPEDYPEYMRPEKPVFCKVPDASSPFCSEVNGNGKVIGEFVCDCITGLRADNGIQTYYNRQKGTCLSDAEIIKYASGKKVYYWHISDLKIYDEPKELGNFWKADKCPYATESCCTYKYHCFRAGQTQRCGETLTRPPQSWCYVEELEKAITQTVIGQNIAKIE